MDIEIKSVASVSADKYYAVDNDGEKLLVQRYEDEAYGLLNLEYVLQGIKRDPNVECCTVLQDALETFMNEGMHVYEFDTLKEAVDWIIS